ncbi:unnamed protein product, partial [Meganyctiphanes norvegica]
MAQPVKTNEEASIRINVNSQPCYLSEIVFQKCTHMRPGIRERDVMRHRPQYQGAPRTFPCCQDIPLYKFDTVPLLLGPVMSVNLVYRKAVSDAARAARYTEAAVSLTSKMASTVKDNLMVEVVPDSEKPSTGKVSVVGCGQVGMACAFSLLTQQICSELALTDVNEDKLRGEMLDLQHGLTFLKNVKISASSDSVVTAGSKVIIITAGARQKEGESRLSLVQRNVEIFKGLIPPLVKHSPNAVLVVVANPVDILTYVAWKLSGLPKHRVIGSGCNLDSARFRFHLSTRLNIAPSSCHGWIIGEHGDSSVPVWSGMNIAGVRLRDINPKIGTPEDPDNFAQLHKDVINSAYEIIKLKGYTSWAIGVSCSTLARGIIKNLRNVFSVTCSVQGHHGIEKDVFLSLPCVVGEEGITHIIKQQLDPQECEQLQKSANTIFEVQAGLTF